MLNLSVDYSAKPWNRQKDFESFIAPKKNKSQRSSFQSTVV